MASSLGEQKVRVFVAVEVSDEVKAELAGIVSAMDALAVRGVRMVRPGGVHLTLKFLGDVSAGTVPEIQSAMSAAASEVAPFDLSLGDAGVFPNPGAARVLWVGIGGDLDSLRRLQLGVEENLNALGFRPERRGFNPHITVGRIRERVSRSQRRRVTDALFSLQYARAPIHVGGISLIQTTLHPDGSIYEPIHSVALSGG